MNRNKQKYFVKGDWLRQDTVETQGLISSLPSLSLANGNDVSKCPPYIVLSRLT